MSYEVGLTWASEAFYVGFVAVNTKMCSRGNAVVYFIQRGGDGPIKIGYTYENLFGRLSEIQVGCPEELRILGIIVGGTMDTEEEIHRQFRAHWIRGEWFHPAKPLLQFIATHAAVPEDPVEVRRSRSRRVTVIRSERGRSPRVKSMRTYSPKVIAPLTKRECHRCHVAFQTREKDKYCHICTATVLAEMKAAKYLGDRGNRFEREPEPPSTIEEDDFYGPRGHLH